MNKNEKKHNLVLANVAYRGIVEDYQTRHLIIDLGAEYVERYII